MTQVLVSKPAANQTIIGSSYVQRAHRRSRRYYERGHGVNPHGMLERTAEGVRREKGY